MPQKQKFGVENRSVTLIGGISGGSTGLSRYARNLYAAMADQEVNVKMGQTKLPPLPEPLFKISKQAGFDLKAFFTTYPLFLQANLASEILHLTSQNQASAVVLGKKSKVIVTVHDLITLLQRDLPELTGYMKFYDKFFDNLAVHGIKKAAMLIADSEHTRQDIIRGTGYPSEDIHVIHLGVEHQLFYPQLLPDEFYARYNLNPQLPYILYVGSEDPRKNLKRLMKAFSLMLKHIPDARLLKVGTARFAGERQQLLNVVEEDGLAKKVYFIDQVNDRELAYFYNLATVFIFPSLYEGFGLPPLEAMACGTPVITSNTSSLPEIVGDAALTINPYDIVAISKALEQVLSNKELRTRLRQRGFERARQFSWKKTAEETLNVYQLLWQKNGM